MKRFSYFLIFCSLMAVAYILLCRDIELACDEKVIKELGNEQRADYTQALVHCSVSRRMIAACPLAFGEVGVKLRVKNIMNYKKPGFWIVMISLVLCIVVAVCFLTNPSEHITDVSVSFKNAISFAEKPAEIVVIYCPPSDEVTNGSILMGRAYGAELATQLNEWDWEPCDPPRKSLPSPGSVEFLFSDYRILVHQRKSGSLHQYAIVQYKEETQYYKIARDDYDEAVALVHAHGNVDSTLKAKLLEISEGYYLVEPVEGSWELTCSTRIMVPMRNMAPSPEPVIGDILQIEYDGLIQETYPARITNVYRISVAERSPDSQE